MSCLGPPMKALSCLDPVKHILETISYWILPGHSIWFFLVCWCLDSLCNVLQMLSALSSGWSNVAISTVTELWLVVCGTDANLFFQEDLLCSSTFPLAVQISLSAVLGNTNKTLPQDYVLSCSQPDFFIHFISLCVQKNRVSNRFFITLSTQT